MRQAGRRVGCAQAGRRRQRGPRLDCAALVVQQQVEGIQVGEFCWREGVCVLRGLRREEFVGLSDETGGEQVWGKTKRQRLGCSAHRVERSRDGCLVRILYKEDFVVPPAGSQPAKEEVSGMRRGPELAAAACELCHSRALPAPVELPPVQQRQCDLVVEAELGRGLDDALCAAATEREAGPEARSAADVLVGFLQHMVAGESHRDGAVP